MTSPTAPAAGYKFMAAAIFTCTCTQSGITIVPPNPEVSTSIDFLRRSHSPQNHSLKLSIHTTERCNHTSLVDPPTFPSATITQKATLTTNPTSRDAIHPESRYKSIHRVSTSIDFYGAAIHVSYTSPTS